MPQFGWSDCPADVRAQVTDFAEGVSACLRANLVGVYLHGSLAMGGFNPARSDIDLLIVTQRPLSPDEKRAFARITLDADLHPRPLELSVLSMPALHPWGHPTRFEFHYSDDWRAKLLKAMEDGVWRIWPPTDPDLAAHITITRHRGICLVGQPVADIFPDVPRADYLDSILADFDFARERLTDNPVYAVLNFSRIYIYLLEDRITSKDEGGEWALAHLPEYAPLILAALHVYRTDEPVAFNLPLLTRFADDMWGRINQLLL
jgi:predicted nucleotidyltransferase